MTPGTQARVTIVKEELRKGMRRRHIAEKWCGEFGIAPRTMDFLITQANRELTEEQKQKKEIVDEVRQEHIKNAAKESLMSEIEAEACLAQIIRGERMEERVFSTGKGPEVLKMAPATTDVIKAIKLLSNNFLPKEQKLNNENQECKE
jgi:hypothetical protein